MERERRFAFGALAVALAAEVAYLIVARAVLHTAWGRLLQPLIFVLLFGSVAVARGRLPWIDGVARVVVGAEFCLSVADRFGWLGAPGQGVSWGDFAHFVAYTRQVLAFLPASVVPLLAILATIFESIFGLTLILGIGLAWTTRGAAVLLLLFAGSMTASGLIESQFFYAVFVLAAGVWAISASGPWWMSLDRLVTRRAPARPAAG